VQTPTSELLKQRIHQNGGDARQVPDVLEHLFRREAGKMVATLTGIFGIEHLTLAEDVVQEALARAMQIWPFRGVPANPSAWIMRVSRNLALDVVRRDKVFREKTDEIVRLAQHEDGAEGASFNDQEIADDRLRMMFVCCHPSIPPDAQVALALKTLCGFGVAEISRAFLTSEAAIAKRLTRTKQKIREARIPFEIPAGKDLAPRLDGVLCCIYLLYNEGYKASSGDKLVREDICEEAIRLGELVVGHPVGNLPKTHALLALLFLNSARFPARSDSEGNLLRLQDQDRSQWDKGRICRGMYHLVQSAAGEEISQYHLQAGIAACHCAAKDYESTDWARILSLYDHLAQMDNSPIIALNRAVAIANVRGAEAAISAVEAIRNRAELDSYHLLYAVMAELEVRRGNHAVAEHYFRQALKLTDLNSEKVFLSTQLKLCGERLNEARAS
jgi:RNA polymerase sigma factor (sigma-70 family)